MCARYEKNACVHAMKRMLIIRAGFPMAQPMVNRAGIDGAIAMWSVRGYFIDDGSCQWATEDQNVVCIVATEKTVVSRLRVARQVHGRDRHPVGLRTPSVLSGRRGGAPPAWLDPQV